MPSPKALAALLKDRTAVTAVEYGLITALIAGTCTLSLTTMGSRINNTFVFIRNSL